MKQKKLEDALTPYTLCRLMDPGAWDCGFELAQTLDKLGRSLDAARVRALLLEQLPEGDKRRALVKKRPAK